MKMTMENKKRYAELSELIDEYTKYIDSGKFSDLEVKKFKEERKKCLLEKEKLK